MKWILDSYSKSRTPQCTITEQTSAFKLTTPLLQSPPPPSPPTRQSPSRHPSLEHHLQQWHHLPHHLSHQPHLHHVRHHQCEIYSSFPRSNSARAMPRNTPMLHRPPSPVPSQSLDSLEYPLAIHGAAKRTTSTVCPVHGLSLAP